MGKELPRRSLLFWVFFSPGREELGGRRGPFGRPRSEGRPRGGNRRRPPVTRPSQAAGGQGREPRSRRRGCPRRGAVRRVAGRTGLAGSGRDVSWPARFVPGKKKKNQKNRFFCIAGYLPARASRLPCSPSQRNCSGPCFTVIKNQGGKKNHQNHQQNTRFCLETFV